MNVMMMRYRRTCAAAFLALTAVGCGARAERTVEADTAPKAVPVTVAPLEHRSVERAVEIVGTLKGYEEVTVGSKRMGRVARVVHDMGDRVRPGEPLVELETIDADLAVEQAKKQVLAEVARLGANPKDERLMAELAKLRDKQILPGDFDVMTIPSVVQAKVALDRARTNLNRQRSLTNRGAGTAQELQYAVNDVDAAVAALDNAVVAAQTTLANALVSKVVLDVAQENRNDTVIRAPVLSNPPKGREQSITYAVTKRYVSEGQMLNQGEAVADLVIEDPLRLWADVPERFSTEIKLGQTVRITVASRPDDRFEGVVARINPAVDPVSRTFQVEAAVPNDDGLLRPGGFAKARIITRRDAEALVVPREAVYRFAGVIKLFIVEDEKARGIPITTDLEGRGWVEVRGNLPANALVITTGQTQLADGASVVVRTPRGPVDSQPDGIETTAAAKSKAGPG